MTSSYGTDIFTQSNQFRPATFQPDPPQVYQNPNSIPPHVPQAAPPPSQRPGSSRPHSIAELAERAKQSLGDDPRPFKTWLRIAENARRDAKSFREQGDLESAFIEYARAATIVLEKIPAHPDYRVLLSTTQRHNMGLHGQEILDSLAAIKISIMKHYEQWRANPSAHFQSSRTAAPNPTSQPPVAYRNIHSHGTNTPSSSSTRSSSRSRASIPSRSHTASPYDQSPHEEDRVWRESVDAMLREDPRQREEGYFVDGARPEPLHAPEDDTHRRREWEEEDRHRIAEHRLQEQNGILRRQREAEHAAQAARFGQPTGQNQSVTMAPGVPVSASFSAVPAIQYPSLSGPATVAASAPFGPIAAQLQMPLESPTRNHPEKHNKIPVQPITTTSPAPPNFGSIQYPSLMSQHQISQGYHPSLGSMFHRPAHLSQSGLLFRTTEPASLPHPQPQPQSHHQFYQHLPKKPQPPHAPYAAGPVTRPPPPLPPKELVAPPVGGSDPVARELKAVSFPRDCLNRFTSIASINTARNRETCGLLLGKDKGGRFVVTTLLIPKQHSTSDTCAMDEEELVMQFTEERSLITLGWIHTHPTQSCFMSSVDLHTHSGFQCMLPESFAVVCAPNSTPNFGIFRLTDPPGLQTILQCRATAAFHPHPELPIYTDADKGHVQIRDLPLEIVDLR